jgi:hypothetical protein
MGCADMSVQEGFVAEDDFGASADYTRENDDEAAAIAERKRWDEKNAALQTAQVFPGFARALLELMCEACYTDGGNCVH